MYKCGFDLLVVIHFRMLWLKFFFSYVSSKVFKICVNL